MANNDHKHMLEQSELRSQSLEAGETLALNSVFLIQLGIEQIELLAKLVEAQIETNLKLSKLKGEER